MQFQLFERYPGSDTHMRIPAPEDVVFNPRNGLGRLMNKPDNCLWTSTYTGEKTGSAWIQLILSGDFRSNPFDCYLLIPDRKAKLLTIDNQSDLHREWQRYPLRNPQGRCLLDFEAIARRYDAMRLTERGSRDCCSSIPSVNLHWWDCESTVWFRPVWTVKHLGMMTFQIGEERV